jgi:Ca2+ transporting ATPase
VHFFQQTVFQITPLSGPEWIAVLELSVPVIALDEILKALSRSFGMSILIS